MTRYKRPLWYAGFILLYIPLFFMLFTLLFVVGNLIEKLLISTLPLAFLFLICTLVSECNYIEVTEKKIIVRNSFRWWKEQHFYIKDIAHISFGKTIGNDPCIFFKVLTPSRWSKRCYVRLVGKKRLRAFAQHLQKLDIPYNEKEFQRITKY